MKTAVIIFAFVAVCWLLGSAKPKKGRKRKSSTRKNATMPSRAPSPSVIALRKRERELREQAKRQLKAGRHESAEKSIQAANRQLAALRKEEVIEEFDRHYRESGTDLGMISSYCGESGASCECWHGRIISVLGREKGWPTIADLDCEAIFGEDAHHSIDPVSESFDADEIALQKAHPIRDYSPESLFQNLYEIDIDRYIRKGKKRNAAIVAVARDRLTRAIQTGLIVEAEPIVSVFTDAQVLTLCPSGKPPMFEPFKATKRDVSQGARESFDGETVTIRRDGITAERIIAVCGI